MAKCLIHSFHTAVQRESISSWVQTYSPSSVLTAKRRETSAIPHLPHRGFCPQGMQTYTLASSHGALQQVYSSTLLGYWD